MIHMIELAAMIQMIFKCHPYEIGRSISHRRSHHCPNTNTPIENSLGLKVVNQRCDGQSKLNTTVDFIILYL